MKIVLGICTRFNEILELSQVLEHMGHEVYVWNTDLYLTTCSYKNKKLYKLGYKKIYNEECKKINQDLYNMVEKYNIDQVLFVNTNNEYFSPTDIERLQKSVRVSIWYVDNVVFDNEKEYIKACDNVYMFAPEDVDKSQEMGFSHVKYCPVGYNMSYKPRDNRDYEYDIAFVGSMTKERRVLMEKIVNYADRKGYRTYVVGALYQKRLPWKKISVLKKNPVLLKHVKKDSVLPSEAAEIYSKSKICLNIHNSWTEGLNPRAFEIPATRSFQLLNARKKYEGLLAPEIDVAEYYDEDDLFKKIDYYLEHDDEREQIAESGYKKVFGKMSMEEMLRNILENG